MQVLDLLGLPHRFVELQAQGRYVGIVGPRTQPAIDPGGHPGLVSSADRFCGSHDSHPRLESGLTGEALVEPLLPQAGTGFACQATIKIRGDRAAN